ncbi:Hsp70 family protein [Dactylosporangium sp. NPDC005572]|uniref:Hsp70 family protein n=1 Tax=Dactylosporangium sp. NPDC005572 TaxID=3156889 RepID=UPI0033AC5CCB
MFERFVPAARHAVVQAQQAAADLGHDRIGTGHLLLGLLADPDGRLVWMLGKAGVTRAAVLARAGEFGEPGTGTAQSLPFTPRMKTVLELTLREALRRGHHQVTPEHLLLALLREGGGAAVRTLTVLGVPPAALQTGLSELVTEPPEPPVTTVVRESGPPPTKEPTLVVDVGTSASSAALVGADGAVRLLKEPLSGLYSWPSAVCRDGDALLVGSAANGRKRAVPTAYRAEFKRDLGEAAPVPLGDRDFQPEDLVTALLRAFAEQAGGPVHRLVLTVPASYRPGDPRTEAMIAAGERAGFTDVALVPEPVAAGLAPLAGPAFTAGETVLVYDFGGGTFDAALVRYEPDGRHAVLGHAALDDCGGRDVDALIATHLRDTGGPDLAAALAPPGLTGDAALRARLHVADFVRGLKHHLSGAEQVEDYPFPAAPPVVLRRAELTDLVAPLLARTVACCQDLLDRCGVGPAEVAAVLLVGGTTRMPAVAEAVARALDRPLRRPEDPDLAVVQGAATLTRSAGDSAVPPQLPTPDRTPLSWPLPGGAGVLLRWLVDPGARYRGGTPIAVVRCDDGSVRRLTAPAAGGMVVSHQAAPGARIASGDWLTTVALTPSPPR